MKILESCQWLISVEVAAFKIFYREKAPSQNIWMEQIKSWKQIFNPICFVGCTYLPKY